MTDCYLCRMLTDILREAINAGAEQLLYFFNGKFTIFNKEGVNNLVTEADHAAEKAIISVIQKNYPDHFILSEETGEISSASDYKWIIDPIDGTVNFANGIPICCVSIGVEKDGKMILGAVYNPIMNEFYFAEKGKGSTLNGKKIQVSSKDNVSTSCLVTGFPYSFLDIPNGPITVFERLLRKVSRTRVSGLRVCPQQSGARLRKRERSLALFVDLAMDCARRRSRHDMN